MSDNIILPFSRKILRAKNRTARVAEICDKKRKLPVCLIILSSTEEQGEYSPVKPEDVPEFLKDPEVVKALMDGNCCQLESVSPLWYRGEKQELH